MTFRNNHYVPEWYQRHFLPAASGELHIFDKRAEKTKTLPDGRVIPIRPWELLRRGPRRFFCHEDLYTTQVLGKPNTEIEQMLFGALDDKGARAHAMLLKWPITKTRIPMPEYPVDCGNPAQRIADYTEYLDAQKLRTPKGLQTLLNLAAGAGVKLDQNTLMVLMQKWRRNQCTMWAEGLWEIVSTSQEEVGFIFSDDPVTLYNGGVHPFTPFAVWQTDPIFLWRGTRLVMPLSRRDCLIITHIEHAREPVLERARDNRRNARLFDQTIISLEDVHKVRDLNADQVATINFMIKTRAPRYVAGGAESGLFPERRVTPASWASIDATLQHGGFAMKTATSEIMVSYTDGSLLSSNDFGESTFVPGWFTRQQRQKDAAKRRQRTARKRAAATPVV
jgi:hypothetical protein